MRHKNNWMIDLWSREWKRCRKDWLGQVYFEVICMAVVCLIFILFRSRLDRFIAYTMNMPEQIYAFWGILPGAVPGKASFYVRWLLMFLHVWTAWRVCNRMLDSIWGEEERGSIFYLCNQMYSRQQIFLAKYLWNMIEFIMSYSILFAACALLAGKGWGIGLLVGLYLKGVLVMAALISLSAYYAAFSRRRERCFWADILVYGTLAVGNLYKVNDFIVLMLQRADRAYAKWYRMTDWLDGLKWLSPLSWLNPFAEFSAVHTLIQTMVCLAVIAGAFSLGLTAYRSREFD